MKLYNQFNKTPFYIAVQYERIEIIKLLILNYKIDINYPSISINNFFFIKLYNILFNYFLLQTIKLHSLSYY